MEINQVSSVFYSNSTIPDYLTYDQLLVEANSGTMIIATDVLPLYNMMMLDDCDDINFNPLKIEKMSTKLFSNKPQINYIGDLKDD